jgi:serine/threonine protein kinase/Tol biopolymer transport system component
MIGNTLGHYRVGEQLGRGGMGEVYVADDLNLNCKVALKFLPDAFAGDPERMARFEREAKLLASLNHPNIAAIYGLEQADGKRFLVLELVEGETLAQRISQGALPVDEALSICRQIAEGLEAAHEKGVIHRDLKPANVMIAEGDKVKILDFGLAKALFDESQIVDSSQSPTITEAMTRPGVILGTAAYMSPEQAKGKLVDKRADIWAFGCILYECLTGKRAFEGETVTEMLASILKGEPDWQGLPEATPSGIQALLRRCLQKDLLRRLHDAADARIEIEESLVFPQKTLPTVPEKKYRRRTVLWCMLSFGILAFIGIAIWILKSSPPSVGQPPAHVEVSLPPGDRLATGNYPPIALSPDGRHLAYVATRGGMRQLFVRSMDSYEARALLGTEGADCPFFSPDSTWIGFFAGGKLKKIPIAGGTALTICDSGGIGGAAWGSDGMIVFSNSNSAGLSRVSAIGGNPHILTTVDRGKGESSHRWPQFLPGGKEILITVATGSGWDEQHIAALRLGTEEKRIILRGGHTGRFIPTGHLVYYRAGALLAVLFDPVRMEVVGNPPETVAEGVAQSESIVGAQYSFSETGSLAYVSAGLRQFDRRLVWVDREGKVEPLAAPIRAYFYQRLMGPSLSPDGRQIAVQIESRYREIWIYDIARGTLTRLTTESGSNYFPIWTPDGKRITYLGFRAGYRNLYWRDADGTGDEEQLTTGENQQLSTSWSPDGKWLIYSELSPATGYDIWMLSVDGERKQKPFLRTQFTESNAQFSPDGRFLAYQSDDSGRTEIYVRPFPGPGGKYQISIEGGENARWARNGRELFFRNGNAMMAVDIKMQPAFTAGKPRLLFEGQLGDGDVAPDGKRFLMVQPVDPEPPTRIHLVLNWFEELKQRVAIRNK